jgi:hypothetical protein
MIIARLEDEAELYSITLMKEWLTTYYSLACGGVELLGIMLAAHIGYNFQESSKFLYLKVHLTCLKHEFDISI